MKKILYIDLLSPIGHQKFNELTLKALLKSFEVTTIAKHNFAKTFSPDITIPDVFFTNYNKIHYRIVEIKKINWVINKVKKLETFDLMIFSSYETISFSIKSRELGKLGPKIAIFNHNNLDELDNSKIKKTIFKKINTNIIQLVFEGYMKKYLLDNIKVKNEVIVVPHIVEDMKYMSNSDNSLLKIFIPSKNYNFHYINELINNSNNNVHFTIKSEFEFNTGNVISKPYFNQNEYEAIFGDANFIILPLNVKYNYRISNLINECFSFSKPCFTFNSKLTQYLNHLYPEVVHIIHDKTNIKKIIKEYENINNQIFKIERERFLKEHSESIFLNKISEIFD